MLFLRYTCLCATAYLHSSLRFIPVFHQADGGGYPVMDLGHVVTALNKLDAADEEKIVLASRDGKNLMVVSYADVSRCLESAFQELCSNAVTPSTLQY
jgi:PAB-dependent poly(A)-specific ribonuclease subunit 3